MTVLTRVAALVVAVGLVVAAVVVRAAMDDDGSASRGGLLAGQPLPASCLEELQDLCRRASSDGEVAWSWSSAATAVTSLAGDEPVAILLPAAWADVADDARQRAGRPPLARSEVVARTPLLLVAFADRAEVLAEACGIAVIDLGWQCVGEHAGAPWADLGGDLRWGRVVTGHLAPDTATGLQATATVVAARTGVPFSLSDLRDVDFTSWFGRVERAVADFTPPGGSHLTAMVTRGPSVANVATATEAEATSRSLDTAFGPIVVSVPDPLLEVELVVAGTAADLVADVTAQLEAGPFAEAGWRTGTETPDGAPVAELPPPTESPSGGVLTALRTTWDDLVG